MSYGISAGWDDDIVESSSKGFTDAPQSYGYGLGITTVAAPVAGVTGYGAAKELRPNALSKATELLWRVNDATRAARVAAALEEQEDEEMSPVKDMEDDRKPVESSSVPVTLGSSRASSRVGLLAVPLASADGKFHVRLSSSRRRCPESVSDPGAAVLLQAQVEAGFASSVAAFPSGTPALLSPIGADPKVLLQKYSTVAAGCLGDVAAESFQLAEALFGCSSHGPRSREHQVMIRLGRWLSRVNQRTVQQFLDQRRSMSGLHFGEFTEAQRLEAVFHHLSANSISAALGELHAPRTETTHGASPYFDRLAAILSASGGTPLPGQQRHWIRQQVAEWKRERRHADGLMSPELWRIYSLLAGDLEVLRDCLDWRTAFGVVLWYGQEEDAENEMLAKVVTAFLEAVKQQGMSSRIRPLPGYLQNINDLTQQIFESPRVGQSIRTDPQAESLQFAAIRMAAKLLIDSDVSHFDYTTYTENALEISLSWHFSVLMLALQGETARAAAEGSAFQRLTQQYCQLLDYNGAPSWAVYVAHFLCEHRSRAALVRQLLTSYAKSTSSVVDESALPWPTLPTGWLYQAHALAYEQARNWCGALCCWRKCGGEEARAVTIACGYLLGPAILGHAFSPFKRGAVEGILLAPMTSAARWLLQSLEELSSAMGCHDLLWAEVGREALKVLRQWAASQDNIRFEAATLVQLHWKCERLQKCMLGLPQ